MNDQPNENELEEQEEFYRGLAEDKEWCYTVKTRIAEWVDRQISMTVYGSIGYFAYFTDEFDAVMNPPTSNPIEIYKSVKGLNSGSSELPVTPYWEI